MVKLYRRNRAQEIMLTDLLGISGDKAKTFIPFPRVPKLAEYVEQYGPGDLRTTANIWNDAISFLNENMNQLPSLYEVCFEDILTNPEKEIFKILDFCELPEVQADNARFWEKLGQVGIVQHTNRYGDFELVEEICHANMQRYGYL